MKLSAAGQWMSGENTFGSTDYWFHRQYVWRIAVQMLQSGGDNPFLFSWKLRVAKELGDSTRLFSLFTNLDTNIYGGEVHGHSIMSLPLSMMISNMKKGTFH